MMVDQLATALSTRGDLMSDGAPETYYDRVVRNMRVSFADAARAQVELEFIPAEREEYREQVRLEVRQSLESAALLERTHIREHTLSELTNQVGQERLTYKTERLARAQQEVEDALSAAAPPVPDPDRTPCRKKAPSQRSLTPPSPT
ncbi:hypothetical protein B0F90DRAFT_1716929, partial [Multifurca ochricompacta]